MSKFGFEMSKPEADKVKYDDLNNLAFFRFADRGTQICLKISSIKYIHFDGNSTFTIATGAIVSNPNVVLIEPAATILFRDVKAKEK